MNSKIRIILASTSPRRVDLLTQAGVPFTAIAPHADETPHLGEKPEVLVRRLSLAKARSIPHSRVPTLIIAADTIVVSPDGKQILGKPTSVADAKKTLLSLSGKKHWVLTGYTLLHIDSRGKETRKTRVIRSHVKMRKLDSASLNRYIATGEPMDKAGAYGAQGTGASLVESISGSYTNVVGLPICQVLQDLESMMGLRFLQWNKS